MTLGNNPTNIPEPSSGFRFSARAWRTQDQPISFLMALAVNNPQLISLAAGLVDYDSLPTNAVQRLLADLLADHTPPPPGPARASLQYGTTLGHAALRRQLLDHLARLDDVKPEDLGATPDDIIVTTGSQQLLFILSDVLVDPGDIVITAWPSYFVYTGTLQSLGAQVRCVEMDDQGMIPASLEAVLADIAHRGELRKVKIVYVCSYHQNPTGLTLSASRRPEILRIVERYSMQHRILLLEDAAYRELTFAGDAPPSIKRFDAGNRTVALLQTFSKPFAPGIKTGYGLLPRDLMEAVLRQKGNHDFGSANLSQNLALRAMQTGVYDSHVQRLRARYADKCRAMLGVLRTHLGDLAGKGVHWTEPTGGLYIYLTLPMDVDSGRDSALFSRAIANGVLYVPGEFCYGPDPMRTVPRNMMRLSFGVESIPRIEEGVARLARAIRETTQA